MQHKIQNKSVDTVVMIDHEWNDDQTKYATKWYRKTAFNKIYSRWIATYDAPMFLIVDRVSNIAPKRIK